MQPAEHEDLTTLGELYAERDDFKKATPYWDRIPAIHPGETAGYLNAATVFWDYFQYDDALRLIARRPESFDNPVLFAYEAGAIYENKGQMAQAIDQYVQGAIAQLAEPPPQTGATPNNLSENRLLRLGRRKATSELVEQATLPRLKTRPPWRHSICAWRCSKIRIAAPISSSYSLLN